MGRPARFANSNEYPTHLIWCTRWGTELFVDVQLGIVCLQAMEHERDRMGLDVLAYCLMPDHFHLVIAPTPLKIGRVVQGLKLASTHRLLADGLAIKTPWQEGYYDVGIRDGRQFTNAVEYIHNNPVAAGLVADRTDYKLSSCADWELEQCGIIRIAKNMATLD